MGSREIVIPKVGNVGRYGLGPGSRLGPNVGGGKGGGGGKDPAGGKGGGNGFKGGGFPPGNSGGGGGNFQVDYSTVALLHLDGTNGSTTFTNEVLAAGRGTLWTASGAAAIDTSQSKFGGASLGTLGANPNSVTSAASVDHTFGAGDFTIAGWFRPTNITTTQAIFYTDGAVNGNLILDTTSQLEWRTSSATIFTTGVATINAWNHFAVTRTRLAGTNTEMLFLNGVLEASGIAIAGLNGTSFKLGLSFAGLAPFLGNIDDVIFKKGRCLYTQTFTPPAAPYDP